MAPPRPSKRLLSLAAVSALGLTALGAAPASAATTSVANIAELRAAVAAANANAGRDTINVTEGFRFRGAPADIDITDDLVINGNQNVLRANGARFFTVTNEATVRINALNLRGGAPASGESGGALLNDGGTLTLKDSAIRKSTVTGAGASGGAIFNDGGSLTLRNTVLTSNSATRAGGGIEANGGTTVVNGSTLNRNTTGDGPGNGGGLHLSGAGVVKVVDSFVFNNTAAAEGGGLWNSGAGDFTVRNTEIIGNTAAGDEATQGGGGLFQDAGATGKLTVRNSVVRNNKATGTAGSGGGILNDQGTVEITGTRVTGNTSVRAGGGIEANVGSTTVNRSTLSRNSTGNGPGNGGAIHLTGAGDVKVQRSTVARNTATAEGGGLWNSATGTFLVNATTVSANTAGGAAADQGGGGIFNDGGTLTVRNSKVRNNTASGTSGSGGGIISLAGSLTVRDTVLSGNVARRAGGGIEVANGTASLRDVALRNNVTASNPGNGGGMHVGGTSSVTYTGGKVTGNIASAEGGGLWNGATAQLLVTGVKIRSNTARVGTNVYNQPPGGDFRIDRKPVPAGPNTL